MVTSISFLPLCFAEKYVYAKLNPSSLYGLNEVAFFMPFISPSFASCMFMAVVSAFIPFHKAVRVKVVKTGEDMV